MYFLWRLGSNHETFYSRLYTRRFTNLSSRGNNVIYCYSNDLYKKQKEKFDSKKGNIIFTFCYLCNNNTVKDRYAHMVYMYDKWCKPY